MNNAFVLTLMVLCSNTTHAMQHIPINLKKKKKPTQKRITSLYKVPFNVFKDKEKHTLSSS